MAREEHSREDLLAEATALVERAEIALPGYAENPVIGFRRDGCGSIYLSADRAWHFNRANELRRAYVDGLLYKAEAGRWISLSRQRTSLQVQLVRRELTAAETADFLQDLDERLTRLRRELATGCQIVGQIPADADVLGRIRRWLECLHAVGIARSPRAI